MSNEAKKVIEEHGDVDAFDFLELRDKVPCMQCHRHMASGHAYCLCGRIIANANLDPVIVEKQGTNVGALVLLVKGDLEKRSASQ